jgi:hypothetical protein
MRKTLTVAIAAATLITGMAMPAYAKPVVPDRAARAADAGFQTVQYRRYNRCYPGERNRDCRERMRWERRHGGHYQWRNGRYYRRDNNDAAAAILGFALGAAILGSQSDYDYYYSHRSDRRYLDRCRVRYRSFDPYTGTYVTTTGYRRYCRY